MRIQLNRERNNEFSVPESVVFKNKIRIISVYEDAVMLPRTDYQFIGPRRIKLLRQVKEASKIYGKIIEISVGNRFISG